MAVGQNQWYHFGVGAPPNWDVHWGLRACLHAPLKWGHYPKLRGYGNHAGSHCEMAIYEGIDSFQGMSSIHSRVIPTLAQRFSFGSTSNQKGAALKNRIHAQTLGVLESRFPSKHGPLRRFHPSVCFGRVALRSGYACLCSRVFDCAHCTAAGCSSNFEWFLHIRVG